MTTLSKEATDELLAHFPSEVSNKLIDYIDNVAFLKSRYIFVTRVKRNQLGYCTHCRNDFDTDGLKHNELSTCPKCHSLCKVKQSGQGRKFLRDYAYVEWFEKSLSNPSGITVSGYFVVRDYSGDYRTVETKFQTQALYVFEQGKSMMVDHYYWNKDTYFVRKSIFSLAGTSMSNTPCFFPNECVEEAVQGTSFQYSTWENYKKYDLLKFFDIAAKHPCVEYLTKFGMSSVIESKLYGRPTHRAINWKGKTLSEVLKLNKQDLKQVRENSSSLDTTSLFIFQNVKKDGSNLTIEQVIDECSNLGISHRMKEFNYLRKLTTIQRIFNYAKKQNTKVKKGTFNSVGSVLSIWGDYLEDCKQLDMDVTDESILFPTDLHKAHLQTIERVKVRADETLNLQMQKRAKALKKFNFEYNGLLIRAFESSKEMVEEGNKLKHCIANYMLRYAQGQTSIFVIRKITNPTKPFFTIEIRDGRIIQVYGLKNCQPTKEVQVFLDAFKRAKLEKKKEKLLAV